MKKIIKKIIKKPLCYLFPDILEIKVQMDRAKNLFEINPFKRNVIFDVGANNGDDFIPFSVIPWFEVHAFEPTPELADNIRLKTKRRNNYKLNEVAISDVEGEIQFNVAGQGDWGCSSILEFSDNVGETWKGREDLKFTKSINVKTTKLSSYIENNKIKCIDFLHIDVQGYDLVALKSLGKFIEIVKSGVVEVPSSDKVKLYKNQHTKEDMLTFLKLNNFCVTKITLQQNEENIYYKRGNNLS